MLKQRNSQDVFNSLFHDKIEREKKYQLQCQIEERRLQMEREKSQDTTVKSTKLMYEKFLKEFLDSVIELTKSKG